MKKSELRTMIREIVREEVALTVKEVIKEIVGGKPHSQPKSKPKKKHYSKNKVLNDVLNETVYDSDEWKTLGGETFDSNKINSVLKGQYADVVNGSSQPNLDGATSMGVDPNDPANSFLTKDYSKTLKAMDKAAKKSRGNV